MPNNYILVNRYTYGILSFILKDLLYLLLEQTTMSLENTNRWGLIILTVAFLICIGGFIYQTQSTPTTTTTPDQVKEQWYRVETARGELLENKSIVGNCHICHAYWVPIPRTEQTSNPRFAHANIQLSHGNNNRCYNCHHISDRNKYTANDGSKLMVQNVEKLCARCHGLIYNDWQAGTHGKWIGSWTANGSGNQKTFGCTECHDPHDPVFKYDVTAPAPAWADKFIRTESEDYHPGPLSNFLVSEKPEEIF